MIINHSAKSEFLKDEAAVKQHRQLVAQDSFQKALVYARAEYCTFNPSSDQISAVNAFIGILNNIAEEDEKGGVQFPHKHLHQPEPSTEGPPQTETKK